MGGVIRYDAAAVRARFDLEPRQLPDYRGLKGDPSDNLPGIPGVGEKTAIKLIKTAGSLDALLANPSLAGSPKLEGLVREHGEIARRCRDVSVIARDLDVAIPWERARYAAPPASTLYPLYRDLEFKSLLAKLPAPENDAVLFPLDDADAVRGTYRTFVPSVDPPEFVLLAEMLCERGATLRRSRSRCAARTRSACRPHRKRVSPSGPKRSNAKAWPPRSRGCSAGATRLVVHDWKHLQQVLRARGLAAGSRRARSPTIR